MSNFKRKLRRNIAKNQGLPVGFYCKKMQNRIAKIDRAINDMNKIIEASQQIIDTSGDVLSTFASEEIIPDGEEDNTNVP